MSVFDIEAAELQREEIEQRLERLEHDLKLTQDAIARAKADYYRLEGRITLLREQGVDSPPKKRKKRTEAVPLNDRVENPKRSEVADAALAFIDEAGRPVGRSELYEALSAKGLRLAGKNPVMVFSTMLWRERKRIARLRGHGYWPADKPYPPADYYPGVSQPSLL